ncbi:MAG: tRNA (adenosine(37)-N6)-threonylcarbamoyltransferase complex dimerization subunit type 1 TsaB [Sorangium cellulosum]|nr:MAG: tRNA (adenosine(37)-N6)-threonylcarbamoyltransferase complex dimerization subunit type 1 TsaB [Sorangium cellulosum]
MRVGMAAAKGLAYSLDLPMVGVTSLAAMAHAGRIEVGPKPVIAMLDAKKGEVFVACYGRAGQLRKGPDHIPRERVQSWISDLCLDEELAVVGEVAGQLSVKNVAWIRTAGCELPGPASTAALAQAMWDDHHRNEIDTLEPLYVRPPDITRSKRMIL